MCSCCLRMMMDRLTCKNPFVTSLISLAISLFACNVLAQDTFQEPFNPQPFPHNKLECGNIPYMTDEQYEKYMNYLKSRPLTDCSGKLCSTNQIRETNEAVTSEFPQALDRFYAYHQTTITPEREAQTEKVPSDDTKKIVPATQIPFLNLEVQLLNGSKLRNNIIKLLGNILHNNIKYLNNNEISSLQTILDALKDNVVFPPTLLPIIYKISPETSNSQSLLFDFLENILPPENQLAAGVLRQSCYKPTWPSMELNEILNGIQAENQLPELFKPQTQYYDFMNHLVNLIHSHRVQATGRLVAAALVNMPWNDEIKDAIKYINIFLSDDTTPENVEISISDDLIFYYMNKLKNSHDDLKLNRMCAIIMKSYHNVENHPKKVNVNIMNSILGKQGIEYNSLFEIFEYNNFPNYIIDAKRELLAAINNNALPIDAILNEFNVYEYKNPVNVLMAFLNSVKNFSGVPDNYRAIARTLYSHVKYMSPNYHIKPKLILTDSYDVVELLEAYDNEKNPEFRVYLENLKSELIKNYKSFNDLQYPEGKNPRMFIRSVLTSALSKDQNELNSQIENFLNVINDNGEPIISTAISHTTIAPPVLTVTQKSNNAMPHGLFDNAAPQIVESTNYQQPNLKPNNNSQQDDIANLTNSLHNLNLPEIVTEPYNTITDSPNPIHVQPRDAQLPIDPNSEPIMPIPSNVLKLPILNLNQAVNKSSPIAHVDTNISRENAHNKIAPLGLEPNSPPKVNSEEYENYFSDPSNEYINRVAELNKKRNNHYDAQSPEIKAPEVLKIKMEPSIVPPTYVPVQQHKIKYGNPTSFDYPQRANKAQVPRQWIRSNHVQDSPIYNIRPNQMSPTFHHKDPINYYAQNINRLREEPVYSDQYQLNNRAVVPTTGTIMGEYPYMPEHNFMRNQRKISYPSNSYGRNYPQSSWSYPMPSDHIDEPMMAPAYADKEQLPYYQRARNNRRRFPPQFHEQDDHDSPDDSSYWNKKKGLTDYEEEPNNAYETNV